MKYGMHDYEDRPGEKSGDCNPTVPQKNFSGVDAMSGSGKAYGAPSPVGQTGKVGAAGTASVKKHNW